MVYGKKDTVWIRRLCMLLFIIFFVAMWGSITTYAYEPAKKIPNVAKMSYRDAFIAVAESQAGYTEDKNGATIYGAWAGDSTQAWCSEFVSWCAEKAGIPKTVIPKARSSRGFRDFYKNKKRFYLLKKGCSDSFCGCRRAAAGTLSVDDLSKGDILITESNGNVSDGADHTCIFLYAIGDILCTLDGNSNDMVRMSYRSVQGVHGVCKPHFKKAKPQKSVIVSAKSKKRGQIALKWKRDSKVTGYQIYCCGNGKKTTINVTKNRVTSKVITKLKSKKTYTVKVRAYKMVKGKKIYGNYSSYKKIQVK